MAFFDQIKEAPDDPILSLSLKFKADSRDPKVNLGVGAYKTAEGKSKVLNAVRKAEASLLEKELPKEYLQIDGDQRYQQAVSQLIFGRDAEPITSSRIAVVQTVGGSGALRLAGEFLSSSGVTDIFMSNPTWANHKPLFSSGGLAIHSYPYYDQNQKGLDFSGMCEAIGSMPKGSAILLHACCHNPTGVDLTLEQWRELSQLIKARGLLPVFDSAYQGFDEGLQEDAQAIRLFVDDGHKMLVCSSNSKNFGLYGERIGALSIVATDKVEAVRLKSELKRLIRANYSTPPCNGARIVSSIMESTELYSEWKEELAHMCGRIKEMRKALVAGLMAKSEDVDFAFMGTQRGMFSYSGLNGDQVDCLQKEYAIYMPRSGRINIAGLNERNVDYVVTSILSVLHQSSTR